MCFNDDISERLPKLKRYARYLTRNESDAEDLTQDCVERAISRQELFKPGTNLDAWMITIMRNIFINGKRSEKLARNYSQREQIRAETGVKPSQMDHVALKQVLNACENLHSNHYKAIRLLCLDQVSYGEAARRMGVPVATAKTRLFRARERLRMQFAA